MNEQNAYKAKYFALSFCAAFFALAVMYLFLISAGPSGAQVAANNAGYISLQEAYQPDQADALTLLLFGTERAHSVADIFILLRFDPVRAEVGVVVFPPQTLLVRDGREETLSHTYRFGGAAYTRDALASFLDIPIDRYARISLSSFIIAANAVGSIEFDLAEDITIQDGELTVTLNAGIQLLDGRQVAALIRHQDYADGVAGQTKMTAQLVSAIINQRIDIVNSTLLGRIFETVINLVDTDVTYSDYEQRINAARHMAALGEDVARHIPLQGQFSDDGEHFILADTALVNLARRFI